MKNIFAVIATVFINQVTKRPPDFIIGLHGNEYMHRWWVIPKNTRFNIYLHKIVRSDDDRALHDHPWFSFSFLLRGSYREILQDKSVIRRPGKLCWRTAKTLHRIEIINGPVWSLFITGRKKRIWGFQDTDNGWIAHYDYFGVGDEKTK